MGVWPCPSDDVRCYTMVEAPNHHGVHSTSLSNIWKVFQPLDMPWMGTWVRPYTVAPVQGGGGFLEMEMGIGPGPYDVLMSWLGPQTTVQCIPHPCHVYRISAP